VKLHWHDESAARRGKIMSAVATIDALHIVVVRTGPDGETPGRRRAKCLERLLYELDGAGVDRLCLEAREPKQNLRDVKTLSVLRSGRIMTSQLRLTHAPGATEPLLWIADAVAGAAAAWLRAVPEYLDEIQQFTRLVTIGP
jgi:hypothetical protein